MAAKSIMPDKHLSKMQIVIEYMYQGPFVPP